MKRFTKKRIAVASALVVAVAVLAAMALTQRETVPQFRFLENHVPVVVTDGTADGLGWTEYDYEFEADFDSVAEKAAEELTARGFTRAKWQREKNPVRYGKPFHLVFIGRITTKMGHEQTEQVRVEIMLWEQPPFWERWIFTIRRTLGW